MNENSTVGVTEKLSIEQVDTAPSFIVETESVFSTVFIVSSFDAKTADEAIEYVMNSVNVPDFIQLHKGEKVVSVSAVNKDDAKELVKKLYPNYV